MVSESNIRSAEKAIGGFCDAAMRGLAVAIREASEYSPFGIAVATLKARGTFYDVATEALRTEIKRVLFVERDQTQELVSGAFGGMGAQAVLADVIAATIGKVIEAV